MNHPSNKGVGYCLRINRDQPKYDDTKVSPKAHSLRAQYETVNYKIFEASYCGVRETLMRYGIFLQEGLVLDIAIHTFVSE